MRMLSMGGLLLVAALATVGQLSAARASDRIELTDLQMDAVTAGSAFVSVGITANATGDRLARTMAGTRAFTLGTDLIALGVAVAIARDRARVHGSGAAAPVVGAGDVAPLEKRARSAAPSLTTSLGVVIMVDLPWLRLPQRQPVLHYTLVPALHLSLR